MVINVKTARPTYQVWYHRAASTAPIMTATTTSRAADPYKSSTFIGHSLWMVPSGAAFQAYSEIIHDTASKLGTFQFIPHITLVAAILTGEADVLEKSRRLASQLAPYEFEFQSLSSRDAYFQCIYATMTLTPKVLTANALARQIFPERQSDPPYMPHLSLVYGDLSDTVKNEEIMPVLANKSHQRSTETQILPVDSIQVWSTQGDVKEWYMVETIPLTGSVTGERGTENG